MCSYKNLKKIKLDGVESRNFKTNLEIIKLPYYYIFVIYINNNFAVC